MFRRVRCGGRAGSENGTGLRACGVRRGRGSGGGGRAGASGRVGRAGLAADDVQLNGAGYAVLREALGAVLGRAGGGPEDGVAGSDDVADGEEGGSVVDGLGDDAAADEVVEVGESRSLPIKLYHRCRRPTRSTRS